MIDAIVAAVDRDPNVLRAAIGIGEAINDDTCKASVVRHRF